MYNASFLAFVLVCPPVNTASSLTHNAKNALKLFSAFNKVLAAVKRVKAVVVDQMKPFFDEFSGLIGEGGSTFEEKLIPPAKMLGKFLNDVGIRLINAIKNIDVDALTQKVKNFVHRQCVPLDQVKFKNDDGPDLFNQECEGLCGV